MKELTLRIKLMLGWLAIVVIPLVIIGTGFYVYLSSSFEGMVKEKTIRVAENLAGMIRSVLQGEMKILVSLAADPQVVRALSSGGGDPGVEHKLRSVFERIGAEYEGLFVAGPDGVIRMDAVDKKRVGIVVAHRPYFQLARQGLASVGNPVISKATGQPIVVACAPVFDDRHAFVGVVASTLKIDFLISRISSVRIGETGYAFMLNSRGVVIAHPVRSTILKENVTAVAGVEKLARRMIRQETGTERYVFRNTPKIAGFSPVKLAGWSIAVTQNEAEFMEPVRAARVFCLFLGGLFLLLTLTGVFLFSRNVGTPIQKTLSTLNKAIEQSDEVFAIIGLDRKVQFVNPAMERITGCTAEDLIGQEPLLNSAGLTAAQEVWRVLDQGNSWSGHVAGNNRSGVAFNLEVTISPIRDEKGGVFSYLETGHDVTRELRLEEQLRQGQKMEAIGTLAGGIAHDFNNILSAILGYGELALIPREDHSKTAHYIRSILNAAERARELVSQILTFSRKREREHGPLDPGRLIKEALKLLRATLPATIEIQEEIKSSSPMLGDPTQLHQVIMNLCTNAAYAMREKGGVLRVGLDDTYLDEQSAWLHPGLAPGPYLQLKISDTGHGMSPEVRERIFDPFFSTKPQGEGTGLGLSVVHGIVKSLKGEMTVYSEPGQGAQFCVLFPMFETASLPVAKNDVPLLPRGNERIMLVDDEVSITDVEKEILEYLGYRVTVFNECTAALEYARGAPDSLDVVITDYTMPQMTGLELVAHLRNIRSDIPIVLCSGYFDPEVERRAGELGIFERLNKPVTTLELAVAVRRVLQEGA